MIRRLTWFVAAFALVYAMAAPPVVACDTTHAPTAEVAGALIPGFGESHSAHQSDCAESEAPKGQEHDSDCLVTCLSMVGCSAPSFVVETAELHVIDQASPPAASSPQSHPSRSFAPDRPPPRS